MSLPISLTVAINDRIYTKSLGATPWLQEDGSNSLFPTDSFIKSGQLPAPTGVSPLLMRDKGALPSPGPV